MNENMGDNMGVKYLMMSHNIDINILSILVYTMVKNGCKNCCEH